MSRPAASCALMTHATASRYCSRNIESPSAALKERPSRLSSNHSGRGYDPVIAVGSIRSRVTLSIDSSSAGARGSPHPKFTAPPRPAQDVALAKDLAGLQRIRLAVVHLRDVPGHGKLRLDPVLHQ